MKFQHFAIPAALLLVPCQAQAGVPVGRTMNLQSVIAFGRQPKATSG
jgi:hypothetical protein